MKIQIDHSIPTDSTFWFLEISSAGRVRCTSLYNGTPESISELKDSVDRLRLGLSRLYIARRGELGRTLIPVESPDVFSSILKL